MTTVKGTGPVLGRFHIITSGYANLSLDGKTLYQKYKHNFGVAFSKDPIPSGRKFSVRVLESSAINRYKHWLAVGVTTKSPGSGPEVMNWEDCISSDQCWLVQIHEFATVTAYHKKECRLLPWELEIPIDRTVGCCVSQAGGLHLYYKGKFVEDVMWEGLPTDQPLWGIVFVQGLWRVEADYKVTTPKAAGQRKVTPLPSQPQHNPPPVQRMRKVTPAPTGHPQDYGGKPYLFVEKPPDGLTCAVCHALAHDPVQANCCGNVYCARCIEKWKGRSNSCPTCRRTEQSDPPFNVFPDKRAYRDVRCLSVHCPNLCGKKMGLAEVDNHLTPVNCVMLSPVECEFKRFGCAVVMPMQDMKSHLQTSVQDHLQMTKRRIAELEKRVEEQEAQLRKVEEMEGSVIKLEAELKEERTKCQLMQARLQEMEGKAEKRTT